MKPACSQKFLPLILWFATGVLFSFFSPAAHADSRRCASLIKTLRNSKPGSPELAILVCDEKGDSYERIERAIQQEALDRVFYLEGGLEAYRAFLHRQALLGQPKKEEVRRCVNRP